MIQNQTARRLMYEWHGGQSSAMYAAASSGLVASFVALADEISTIDNPKERNDLMCWVMRRQTMAPRVCVANRFYSVLPWVSRTYYERVAA